MYCGVAAPSSTPSQQCSFSGTRIAFVRQLFMAAIEAWSDGPSKMPLSCEHRYSVPMRSTPCSTTVCADAFTSLLPCTCSPENAGFVTSVGAGVTVGAAVGAGVAVGAVVGAGVVVGATVGVGAGAVTVKTARSAQV